MSMKHTLGYVEKTEVVNNFVHIYRDGADNRYYLETDVSKIELPKSISIKFAEVLERERSV